MKLASLAALALLLAFDPAAANPGARVPAQAAPAPAVVSARIINVKRSHPATEIIVNAGTNVQVAVGWTGEILDAQGQPVPGSTFKIASVTRRTARATITLTFEQVKAAMGGKVTLRP